MRIRQLIVDFEEAGREPTRLQVSLAPTSLSVVVGPNGSGKTVLTTAVAAALASEHLVAELCDDLVQAGVVQAAIVYESKEHHGHIRVDTANHTRTRTTDGDDSSVPLAASDLSGNGGVDSPAPPTHDPLATDLLVPVHVVRSGRLDLPRPAELLSWVHATVLEPLQRELAGWQQRSMALQGETGDDGRRGQILQRLSEATEAIQRAEQIRSDCERAELEQIRLQSEIEFVHARLDLKKAESLEWAKIFDLAERASKLDAWSRELRAEVLEVSSLREQHLVLQQDLDLLVARFRGAPEDVESLLLKIVDWRSRERQLRHMSATTVADREQLNDRLATARQEQESLSSSVESLRGRQRELRREIATDQEELARRKGQRDELDRHLAEISARIRSEFGPFADMPPGERRGLVDWLEFRSRNTETVRRWLDRRHEADAVRLRHDQVKAELHERFADFDRLPTDAERLIRELFERRETASAVAADIEQLRKRQLLLQVGTRSKTGVYLSGGMATAGFGLGTLTYSWDVGLFAALAASGAVALHRWRTLHRTRGELESTRAARALAEQLLTEAQTAIQRLEEELGALAKCASIDDAEALYHEYVALAKEEKHLLDRRRALAAPADMPTLPRFLSEMTAVELQGQFEAFEALESELKGLDAARQEYERNGAEAQRLSDRTQRLAELTAREQQTTVLLEQRAGEIEERQGMLRSEIAELEAHLAELVDVQRLETELGETRAEAGRLEVQLQPFLTTDSPEKVLTDWKKSCEIGAALRQIRDRLSAHPAFNDLQSRAMLLSEELDAVKNKLLHLDPLYLLQGDADDYARRYAEPAKAAARSCDEDEGVILQLQKRRDALGLDQLREADARGPSADDLRAVQSQWQAQLDVVDRELKSTREMIETVQAEIGELETTWREDFEKALQREIATLSGGRFVSLGTLGEDWILRDASGSHRPVMDASQGVKDLAAMAVRLAVIHHLRMGDEWPVVWDEALLHLDDEHLERVRASLQRIAESRQVILLTCHSRFASWGQAVSLSREALTAPDASSSRSSIASVPVN